MVASVQNTANAFAVPASEQSQIKETEDRFLKLLVTQMKNQDPLNPLDNAQVTSQMAQLSTVTGIDKLNNTVQALSSSMLASQSLQAVSMIGHPVLVTGDGVELGNGQGFAAVELAQPADQLTLSINDASGRSVRTLQLGAQDSGIVQMTWDGLTDSGTTAPDGRYTISAVSELGGQKSATATLEYGLVNSVAQSQNGVTVNVGKLGDVSLNAIKQIL
ncbi:MAG: flagellar hook assembly protein FlgD [Gallionella sp.]|nr:flagellar hook assembly protein FlgD [Gallionella sp.]OIO09084.1 MAG: flagellar biosynthesis protein FlgD [Gallionellaceae bacterium CG1_02_60_325]PIV48002.1 MAG: flagellar biosynthesis protein FlgD [Gallionellaceae bacterium CG02_land_8_20_14_3_00_60_115]PJC04754.1 MAG: flagellar biosynthesis protein FlgD [Gallionellaceae bacterium CG_4_9_14_0_8_um_filter_60_335]NCP79908.1 flagellar hook assembly protein FlgD [Gallionella sp.]